ncbi:MAG: ribosome-associated translation inhibitor RaiA [Clostridia bacterium]|nr:MAG: ribosome-associated translation inhibitor RaiA [Clostridia bacterium]
MQVNLQARNMEITGSLADYVEKKIGKLSRYLDAEEAQVTLLIEKNRHVAEVTISLGGIILRGEEETNDMYHSIDLVVEKLERQVRKYKTRLGRRVKAQGMKELEGRPAGEEEDASEEEIVRTKRFAIKPMSVEEAIMQMNLLGHSFFVFANADSEQVNVVYRRKDGRYGLIEPEYS